MKKYKVFFKIIVLLLVTGVCLKFTNIENVWCRGKKVLVSPLGLIRQREKVVINNPYASIIAEVRLGNELHSGEKEYLLQRRPKVRSALEKILHMSLDNKYVPTISVICSGGGYRAMLGSIGSFSGLQAIGLFDAVTYISTLSGSTWALGLLMSTEKTIAQLQKYVAQRLTTDFYRINKSDAKLIGHMLAAKLAFHQPLTTVDLFGAFLAKHLLGGYFGQECQMVHLSDQSEYIKDGNVPFPIYTAVDGRMHVVGKAPWYEFNPFEIGSAEYAAYVPAWAYGRVFNKGKSINYAPEQSLGFCFGIFGSAFGVHIGLAWERVIKDLTPVIFKSVIEKALIKTGVANVRVLWARVRNFMFGLDDNQLKDVKNLKFIDAGIEFNLPYPPVSGERPERTSDILIFFDFSHHIPRALQKAEEYARRKGLKFPVINYDDIEKNTISIFKDEQDLSIPVVIYMPRISDVRLWQEKKLEARYKKYHRLKEFDFEKCIEFGYCKTINFQYTLSESKQVMQQMEFNVVANEDQIVKAIEWVIEQKSIIGA